MNLASYRIGTDVSYGVVFDGGIIDLGQRLRAPTLRALIAGGLDLARGFADAPPDYPLEAVEWLPPITDPTHILGVGLNTRSHFEETVTLMGREPAQYPKYPRLFMRSPLSHVGHLQPIKMPRCSRELDYEGEIALIIGRPCRAVSEAQALDYVAGISCYNDGSVRDFQFHSTQITAGKNFPGSGSFGPWMTVIDNGADLETYTLSTRVNSELRQTLHPKDLLFSYRALIAYISQIFALQPGDVIASGTPAGVGAVQGRFLAPGDVLEIEIPGVGVLRNPIESECDDPEGSQIVLGLEKMS